ncbi:hypothetical protein PSPO01_15260 [Paraphaeosphaeria sporulosa]
MTCSTSVPQTRAVYIGASREWVQIMESSKDGQRKGLRPSRSQTRSSSSTSEKDGHYGRLPAVRSSTVLWNGNYPGQLHFRAGYAPLISSNTSAGCISNQGKQAAAKAPLAIECTYAERSYNRGIEYVQTASKSIPQRGSAAVSGDTTSG